MENCCNIYCFIFNFEENLNYLDLVQASTLALPVVKVSSAASSSQKNGERC